MKHVPSYLERQVLEGEDNPEQQRAELMLCQIDATEAQTEVLERIAAALERIARQADGLDVNGDPVGIDAAVADYPQTARRGF
jgi:hypothetical protein